ncbi:MAG: UbiA-like polyprenyltransferase [Planctomycetota bacterium]
MLAPVRVWAEMVKLSHSVFALPFAMIAAFLAGRNVPARGLPRWGQLGLIVMCMVSARSAAMTFNRIVDAEIDARNPRTANRPLPSGRLSRPAAYAMLALALATFGFACLGFHLFYDNTWPILLSGPALGYLCAYSFTKRFTRWSHFILGSAISMSPAAAWIAVDPGSLGLSALLLMVAVTGWIGGFDIIYACQDIEVDRRDGLHSLPSRLGPAKALWIARASHGLCIAALIGLAFTADLGWIYACGLAAAALLLIVENALVRPGDYRRVNLAFFTINGLVSLILAAAAVADALI